MATDRPAAPGEDQVKDGLIQELATGKHIAVENTQLYYYLSDLQ